VTSCKEEEESMHINLENSQDSVTICRPPHLLFSTLCLTRSADPNEPFPICSNTSYCSIPVVLLVQNSPAERRMLLKRKLREKLSLIRRTCPKQIKNRFKFWKYDFLNSSRTYGVPNPKQQHGGRENMKKENLGTKQELIAWRIEIAMDQLDDNRVRS